MGIFSELFAWWKGNTVGTRWFTLRRGVLVGQDEGGNRYYEERSPSAISAASIGAPKRRWVIYAQGAEASTVPPEWHGWLHKTVAEPPTVAPLAVKPWEKPHRPNLTGTDRAYHPPGSLYQRQPKTPGAPAYTAWVPDEASS